LRWPARRVEGIYKAILIRESVESVEQQRRDMISACYANPNWDGKDNAQKRNDYLRELNRHFNSAITAIYYPEGPKAQEIDWSNPFFAAHKREIAKTKRLFAEAQGKSFQDVIDEDKTEDEFAVDQSDNGRGNGSLRKRDYDQLPDDDDKIPRNT
jgi:hypothetical protein